MGPPGYSTFARGRRAPADLRRCLRSTIRSAASATRPLASTAQPGGAGTGTGGSGSVAAKPERGSESPGVKDGRSHGRTLPAGRAETGKDVTQPAAGAAEDSPGHAARKLPEPSGCADRGAMAAGRAETGLWAAPGPGTGTTASGAAKAVRRPQEAAARAACATGGAQCGRATRQARQAASVASPIQRRQPSRPVAHIAAASVFHVKHRRRERGAAGRQSPVTSRMALRRSVFPALVVTRAVSA